MPVSNEAEIIEEVVEEWVREVIRHLPEGSELVFDEAASIDGTREILERLMQKYPFIRVNYVETKDGFGAAGRRLYMTAKCPLVFFTDSDGQYVAEEFWKLAPFAAEYQFVHGAKIGRQDSFFRKFASAIFNRISRLVFDSAFSDINSAFRLMDRNLAQEIVQRCGCMPALLNAELLLRADMENIPIKQVRVIHRRRKHGYSRGLPPLFFLNECYKAFRGLMRLKDSYRK